MKWLIRIICFIVTTALYIPIETALHESGTNRPFIWIVTVAFYLLIFYVPSNAFIAMYKKSQQEMSRASQKPNPANSQEQGKADPFTRHQRIYNMRADDGGMLRVEEEFLPGFYSVQYGQDFVDKVEGLNRFLENLSADFVRAAYGRVPFRVFIFYWCIYCKAALSVMNDGSAENLLICLFKKSICGSSAIFKHVPPSIADELLTFFSKTYSAVRYSEELPFTEDGAEKLYDLRPADRRQPENRSYTAGLPSEDEENIAGIIIFAHNAAEEAKKLFLATNS